MLSSETEKLRRRICFAAARLLSTRQETDFVRARFRAARSVAAAWVDKSCLPTDLEIRGALQQILGTTMPAVIDDDRLGDDDLPADRFDRYYELLHPLDCVRLPKETHPEGDLLYHSLQVFELARQARPWDEEFLLAALLHEAGRGIDPYDAHAATLSAVGPIVSARCLWFIENLPTQHRLYDGTIGIRARKRLARHEDGDELKLLARCDTEGRVPGRQVPTLRESLEMVEELWES